MSITFKSLGAYVSLANVVSSKAARKLVEFCLFLMKENMHWNFLSLPNVCLC